MHYSPLEAFVYDVHQLNTNSTYISSEGEPTARIRATHLVFHVGLALKCVHVKLSTPN